eukprot:6235205-Amphidinium_carterae.1
MEPYTWQGKQHSHGFIGKVIRFVAVTLPVLLRQPRAKCFFCTSRAMAASREGQCMATTKARGKCSRNNNYIEESKEQALTQ